MPIRMTCVLNLNVSLIEFVGKYIFKRSVYTVIHQ